ncbi:hypothetical protein VTK26DRAFT_4525 [Humicola hyalothermophila]
MLIYASDIEMFNKLLMFAAPFLWQAVDIGPSNPRRLRDRASSLSALPSVGCNSNAMRSISTGDCLCSLLPSLSSTVDLPASRPLPAGIKKMKKKKKAATNFPFLLSRFPSMINCPTGSYEPNQNPLWWPSHQTCLSSVVVQSCPMEDSLGAFSPPELRQVNGWARQARRNEHEQKKGPFLVSQSYRTSQSGSPNAG